MTDDDWRLPKRPPSITRRERISSPTGGRLALFLDMVRRGKTPSVEQLEFVAAGVDRWLDDREPWPSASGRPPKARRWANRQKILRVWLLHYVAGLTPDEIALTLNLADARGTDKARTILRDVKRADTFANISAFDFGVADHGTFAHVIETIDSLLGKEFENLPATRASAVVKALHARRRAWIERRAWAERQQGDGEPGHEK